MWYVTVAIVVHGWPVVHDIAGSRAHAQMLADQGIISAKDAKQIVAGLDKIASEIADGRFTFSRALEDIHMNVEIAA